MKTTQCPARSRFGRDPYWRSPRLCAEGIAGAEEPDAEHADAASPGPDASVEEPVAGALEPSRRPLLSVVLEAVQSHVPKTAGRDRVLDAVRHLASNANKKAARSLASKWSVQQKVGGVNRGTTDILNEVQHNARWAAMRLLQKEEVREESAGAIAREEDAAGVSVSQSGSEAVELRAC